MNYRTSQVWGFKQECVQMVKARPDRARGVVACQGDWMHAEWSPNQIPESERARSKPGKVRVLGKPGPGQDLSSGFPAATSCSADHHCASFHSYHPNSDGPAPALFNRTFCHDGDVLCLCA